MRGGRRIVPPILLLLFITFHASVYARDPELERVMKLRSSGRVMVFDGSGVHNVGNLHMHVTNWGAFGSYPNTWFPTSEFPSAQWPANSGVEHLFIAGLWVGAKSSGIPVVSTAAPEWEFRPAGDDIDRIYESYEGARGGKRLPGPADDDKDGTRDEEWLDGRDNDGDGLIDEDFAAIGKQMFSCWFVDDDPISYQIFPEHTPLHIMVRQESYQWDDERFDDFIGVEYKITNYGLSDIDDVYIGFYADGDVGSRKRGNYWMDDLTGLWEGIVCARRGGREYPVRISVAYFCDKDGDNGKANGYFGVLFLGHETDPQGKKAPKTVGITSYQNFIGGRPYAEGGHPTNDFQRYELMSLRGKNSKDRNPELAGDYMMLMATGPFKNLLPESTLTLQVAFVCGEGLDGMLQNAANAAQAYRGNRFDIDGDRMTGIDGREYPLPGPVNDVDPDSCDGELEALAAAKGEIVWINADCREELALWNDQTCSKMDATFRDYQTGIDGKERQIPWLVDSAPPPPNLRIHPGDGAITLLWDNFSEVTPDVSTLELDFEGYRIWRAEGWTRPIGTSILTGPERSLWQLVEERDLVNGIPPDNSFKKPASAGGWRYEPLAGMPEREKMIVMFEESLWYLPLDTVPCPPGLDDLECDTLEALARYNLGFEGGTQYYRYVDHSVHNGMHYFFSVTAYDHLIIEGQPSRPNHYGEPSSGFIYAVPLSESQDLGRYDGDEVYVAPNPASRETMAPWRLEPNFNDPTGIKVEFRNLPRCLCTVRIYTVSGDLVEVLHHDGRGGSGTLAWDLVSRNGQDVTSGVYLFSVEPGNGRFPNKIGKFVVIR